MGEGGEDEDGGERGGWGWEREGWMGMNCMETVCQKLIVMMYIELPCIK